MTSQDSEAGEGLSDSQIAIELEVFMSAGHETTAHCASSIITGSLGAVHHMLVLS